MFFICKIHLSSKQYGLSLISYNKQYFVFELQRNNLGIEGINNIVFSIIKKCLIANRANIVFLEPKFSITGS